MASIKRKVYLFYDGQTYTFSQLTSSDKQALVFSVRDLENQLGLMHGALKKYFSDKNNWEIRLN